MTWLDALIILWGSCATIMSFSCCAFFIRSNHGIARAVAFDKFAEAVNVGIVVMFAILQSMGVLDDFPERFQHGFRAVAITATKFSTIHLAMQTRSILHDEE